MRRREFLIASSLGVALCGAVARAGTQAAAHRGASPADVHAVVYEPRYPVARDFARAHASRGIQIFRADDCMVRLWRGPLARWPKGHAIRIAGTTLYSDFAIARDCARDLGLVVIREEWRKAAPGTLINWLIGTV